MAQRYQLADGRIVEALPGGGYQVVNTGATALTGADPRIAPQVQKATNEATASATAPAQANATLRKTEGEIRNDAANIALQRQQFDAQLAEKGLMIDASGNVVARPGGPLAPQNMQLEPEKAKALKALQDQLDRVSGLYRQNIKGGLPNPIFGRIPTSTNDQFDTASQGLTNPFMAAFRIPGVGSQSDTELRQFLAANTPSPHDTDLGIQEKIGNIQRRIDAEQGFSRPPQDSMFIPSQTSADQQTLATGGTRDVVDPILKATAGKLGVMVAQGVPDADILKFMRDSGIPPENTNIAETLRTRATDPKFKQWQRQHPGEAYPIGSSLYTKPVPMSATRSLLNAAAADNTAGAAVAAPVAAANALTGGYLNDIVGATGGSAQEAQNGIDLMRSQHPLASLGGDLAGYATAEGLAGLAPGVKALAATKYGRRGIDAAYGAFSGSGENDQDRLTGALTGGVVNTAGGMFGRGLQSAGGAALTGIRNPDLKLLNDAGVPLTVGRIARGAGDFDPMNPATAGDELGKGIAGLEDRFAGFPGLDAVIGTARQRGDQAFNQATFRAIAPDVAGTGAAGLTSAKAAESAAYAKLNPVRLSVDTPFTDTLDAASAAAKGLNHHAGDVNSVVADIRQQIADGGMTGKGYQTAMQTIRKTRSTLNDDVGGKAAAVLDGLEQSMMGLGDRQGGQIAQDLAEANAIHGRRKIVQTALKGGPAQRADEMFSPTSLNQASINNTTKFGGLDRALSPDRPFYDLTHAGMKVMPNLTPDSGTAGRLLLYPLIAGVGGGTLGAATGGEDKLGGAGEGLGVGLGLSALTLAGGAGPYSRTGQKLLQRALIGERPEIIQRIGDRLKMAKRIGGMFGASAARDYFLQPELSATGQ